MKIFMFGIFKPIVLKIKVITLIGQQLIHFILEILLLKNLKSLIDITLSSLVCEEPTDISLTLSQSPNQPDIQSTISSSNLGYIDLNNLSIGQNVGSASVTAGINNFIDNDYSLEISEISLIDNSVTIDLVPVPVNQSQISFEIYNLENGGIELSLISPADNNSYTSGNSLEITLEDIFINPSPSHFVLM